MADTVNSTPTSDGTSNPQSNVQTEAQASTQLQVTQQPQQALQPQQEQQAQSDDLYSQPQVTQQPQEQKSDEQVQQEADKDFELQAQNLDETDIAETKEFCKKLGLNGQQAQAITSVLDKAEQGFNDDLQGRFNTQVQTWRQEVQNDPELGGQNFANTKLNIGRVMQKFGNDEVRGLLNRTGLGYNPSFVRFMNAIGSVLGNDTGFVSSNPAVQKQQTRSNQLRSIYNNSKDLQF